MKRQRVFLVAIISTAMFLLFKESPAAEQLPADPAAARQLVESTLSANADEDASNLLTEIISSDNYKEINDWAITQYYNLAKKNGSLGAAVTKLEALAERSNSVGLERGVAEGYARTGEWNKVAGIYEKLLKENPGDSTLSSRLIDAYVLARNYDGVIAILEPKVTVNPDDTISSDILVRAYVGAKKSDEAVALYNKKVAKEPNSPGLRGRYAQALTDLGMPAESLAQWSTAFQLDPKNLLFKQKMGEVNMQMGNTEQARREYAEMLGLIPESQASLKEMIASRIKDIDAAEKK